MEQAQQQRAACVQLSCLFLCRQEPAKARARANPEAAAAAAAEASRRAHVQPQQHDYSNASSAWPLPSALWPGIFKAIAGTAPCSLES